MLRKESTLNMIDRDKMCTNDTSSSEHQEDRSCEANASTLCRLSKRNSSGHLLLPQSPADEALMKLQRRQGNFYTPSVIPPGCWSNTSG